MPSKMKKKLFARDRCYTVTL